ncbi:hypothetical protein FACS1894141_0890 [Spirochaetia bacterium]|nr:hypothetical protein FACS1894141_0890 [Spirochaetia bacterium]
MGNVRIAEEFYEHNNEMLKSTYHYDRNGCLSKILRNSNEEELFHYDDEGTLIRSELYTDRQKKRIYEYEYGYNVYFGIDSPNKDKKVLKKKTVYNESNNVILFRTFIFEEGLMLKQLNYLGKGILNYEFICKYDEGGKRISTLKPNHDIYSTRNYDETGLLKTINFFFGGKNTFTWEKGMNNYNFDMYRPC